MDVEYIKQCLNNIILDVKNNHDSLGVSGEVILTLAEGALVELKKGE